MGIMYQSGLHSYATEGSKSLWFFSLGIQHFRSGSSYARLFYSFFFFFFFHFLMVSYGEREGIAST